MHDLRTIITSNALISLGIPTRSPAASTGLDIPSRGYSVGSVRSASAAAAAAVHPKQGPGEAVQSSHQWIFGWGLIGVLAVIVAVGCEQHVDGLGNNPPMTREIAHSGQVDLDVAAIVAGMTRAHGAQEVASLPKWWRDLLSQP